MLRADLAGGPSFRALLKRVRRTALGAYTHQDLPFEQVVDALHPRREPGRTPLFQVLLVHQNAPAPEARSTELALEPIEVGGGVAKFDLSLIATEHDGGVRVAAEYDADLFDGSTIERLLDQLQLLLTGAVAEPDRPVAALPIVDDEERRRVVDDWARRPDAEVADRPFHRLVEEQAERVPDAVAVEIGGEALTYRELNERANRLAHHLRGLGVGPESRVGLCIGRSAGLPVGMLGILKAGGASVPLDPDYPADRLAFMLRDAGIDVLVTVDSLIGPPRRARGPRRPPRRRRGGDRPRARW